jgi:thiol-disulfide isomerase/thioredoxin
MVGRPDTHQSGSPALITFTQQRPRQIITQKLAKSPILGHNQSMPATPSTMVELGRQASEFHLPSVADGRMVSLSDFDSNQGLLVMFICRHCPYVLHVKPELARLAADYIGKSVGIIGISSNDARHYPDDAPEKLIELSRELGVPVLYDESQAVAKTYQAACTPDFFLFDEKRMLVYRGQLDDSRPGNNRPLNGHDLRSAIEAVLSGKPVATEQRASIGCNIKWKPGNEPDYFR